MVHEIWKAYPEVEAGLEQVKAIIKSEMVVLHPDVKEKIDQYIDAPGKYLRAGLCLFLAREIEGQIVPAKLYFAAHLEVLHLATLIHDDVIDQADYRRGIQAAHIQFSNRIAIYAGDYLLAYAGRLLAQGLRQLDLEEKDVHLAHHKIVEWILRGELEQLLNAYNVNMTPRAYLKQIQGKTASLFGYAYQLGLFYPGQSLRHARQAYRAGRDLGMAFQIRDDLIDYKLDLSESGKPGLQDVQNGIYTLPLLLALQDNEDLAADFEELVNESSPEKLTDLHQKILATSALERTEIILNQYLDRSSRHLRKLSPQVADSVNAFLGDFFHKYF